IPKLAFFSPKRSATSPNKKSPQKEKVPTVELNLSISPRNAEVNEPKDIDAEKNIQVAFFEPKRTQSDFDQLETELDNTKIELINANKRMNDMEQQYRRDIEEIQEEYKQRLLYNSHINWFRDRSQELSDECIDLKFQFDKMRNQVYADMNNFSIFINNQAMEF
ncbi:ATK4, partial [Acrasis kona]